MKILVTVKRVPDPETVIRISPDATSIVTDNVKWVINPFDEIAIEEGLRLKEIPLAELGVDAAPRTRIVKLETPPKRTGGRKVGSVQELVQVLHDEAKVI